MSTRCYIGILNQETYLVDYVYCHYDGYLEGVGRMLIHSYNTSDKIKKLLSYGDMSAIDNSIENCCFYMRDRGEENCEFKTKILVDYKKLDEILYLYTNEWLTNEFNETGKNKFLSVEKLIIEQMKNEQKYGEFVNIVLTENLCGYCSKEKYCNLKFKSGIFNSCLRFLEYVALNNGE